MTLKYHFVYIYVILLFFCACSSPITINHYSIEHLSKKTKQASLLNANIGIEGFSSINALQRNEIIIRTGNTNKIEFSTNNFWWTLPKEMIAESFLSFLQSQNLFTNVLPYPTLHQIKYVITGKIHRFEVQQHPNEWRANIAISVKLVDANTQKILWQSSIIEHHTKCSEKTMDSAALAMEQNITETYDSIYQKMKQFLGQKSE